jgi:hypothetical protein
MSDQAWRGRIERYGEESRGHRTSQLLKRYILTRMRDCLETSKHNDTFPLEPCAHRTLHEQVNLRIESAPARQPSASEAWHSNHHLVMRR